MKLEEIKVRISALEKGVEGAIKEKEEAISILTTKIEMLEEQARNRNLSERKLIDEHSSEISKICDATMSTTDTANIAATLAATRDVVSSLYTGIKSLEKKLVLLQWNLNNLERTLEERNIEVDTLKLEVVKLRASLESKEKSSIALVADIEILKKQLKEFKELYDIEIQKLQREITELQNQLYAMTSSNHELTVELDSERKANQDARITIDDLRCDIDRVEKERQKAVREALGANTMKSFISYVLDPGVAEAPLRKPGIRDRVKEMERLGLTF